MKKELMMSKTEVSIKKQVRKGYAKIVTQNTSCCSGTSCCGSKTPANISKNIGYTEKNLKEVPDGANLGLGCGNPVALASLKKGEIVLDLGSGAGFDCFLAANRVGTKGNVIGVDMTPEMIERARQNALKSKYKNIEFRLGEIEKLPVADNSIDIVISNCVINLVPDKKKSFQEIFRVLKPNGRIMISDIVLNKKLPSLIKNSVEAYIGCLSGAILKNNYLKTIKDSGFKNIKIIEETKLPLEFISNDPTAKTLTKNLKYSPKLMKNLANSILSIKVSAEKKI